jgi:CubicO group peptidase (beta-lactamase class C family)/ketosteroid isomerase-like protein
MTRIARCLTTAFLAAAPLFSQAPARNDLKTAIDSFIDQAVAADAFSGAALVARNGQVTYQRAAGIANRETHAPVGLDTRLQIASATKLFTQIAIRQQEQDGKLSLSDTVGKFLPKYPNAIVRSKVTIEMLLRHRSGVGSFWNERYMATRGEVRSVNDYLELFQTDSLLFEPGSSEAYSNGGFVILGAIIERVSGKSYHEYLMANVFSPAGMTETVPYDRKVAHRNSAIGYTSQSMGGAPVGDSRLAGRGGPRPGYAPEPATSPAQLAGGESGPRLRIMSADGRVLSQEDARAAVAARNAAAGGVRRSNADTKPGLSSPAGDHFSTVGDFLKLANALTSYRLLDSTHTAAVLGARYARGDDMRANGGGPGVNAEFSIYPTGDVMVVLANYDPPSATSVAQFIRGLIGPQPIATTQGTSLKTEVEALHAEMVAAFKRAPASVARFYADDASLMGGGQRAVGRAQIDQYWSSGPMPTDWAIETLEVGGDSQSPWVRGRSTLSGQGGRRMVTDFVTILKRQPDGRLRIYIDIYVSAGGPAMRPMRPPQGRN